MKSFKNILNGTWQEFEAMDQRCNREFQKEYTFIERESKCYFRSVPKKIFTKNK